MSRLITAATFIVLLLAWQAAVRLLNVPAYMVPAPSDIALRAWSDMLDGSIGPHLEITVTEVISGFLLAAFFGLVLGSLIGLVPFFEKTVYPVILALQTVPKIAVAPLLVIWFGFGIQSKVITAAVIALFPILVNVITGLKTVDERRILLMRSLRASSMQTFFKVRLPSMLPYLFAGLEIGVIFAVIGAIVGEFLGSSVGLGSLIIQRQSYVDVTGVFSVLLYLCLMGLAFNLILRMVAGRYAFWARRANLPVA